MSTLMRPGKPRPGDRVAVVSPSSGLPQMLPRPFELGLRRLREDFGLIPVEYPTTRTMGATAAERAADLHAAFGDPSIRAVLTSIGGDDQITVLRHLDADVLRADPKPFLGYSDNTNLLAYLYSIGIAGLYGGAIMTEFGRPVAMHPHTAESLRAALFGDGEYELRPAESVNDVDRPWDEAATFESAPTMRPSGGWTWLGGDATVTGRAWGGCLEIVGWLLAADLAVPPLSEFDGAVLFLETSEEMPGDTEVYRVLRNMGERGILGRCGALLMGLPKAWSFERRSTDEERAKYIDAQHRAVRRAVSEYAPGAVVVLDVNFGHTDPQLVIPYGGMITVDGTAHRITVQY